MNSNIEQLQRELHDTLKRAEKHRRVVGVARVLCYGGALVWFIGIIAMQFFVYSGGDTSLFYTLDPNPTFFEQYKMLIIILPLFVLISLGSYGLAIYQKKFTEAEQSSIRRIVREMFPDAKLSIMVSDVSDKLLRQSNFFGGMNNAAGQSFGTIAFEKESRKIAFRDIIIHSGGRTDRLTGGLFLIFKTMFRGMFAVRVENVTAAFRGIFATAQLEKRINGSVVVLPDHLESKLDYLAKNIQALKNVNGNKLVLLEDPEFERLFAVYAGDEITARYVLTPAMMRRMTELKEKYGRDIMLSFSGDNFYFAVAMPEGFLTLGSGSSLSSGEALKDLYDNVATARDILNDLKLN
jgi:hypothetical protein